jgi:hypothetical protein
LRKRQLCLTTILLALCVSTIAGQEGRAVPSKRKQASAHLGPSEYSLIGTRRTPKIDLRGVHRPAMTMVTHLYFKGDKSRQENSWPGGGSVEIDRRDKLARWVLEPSKNTCWEIPMTARSGPRTALLSHIRKERGVEYLGNEMINGHLCERYRLVSQQTGYDSKPMTVETNWWVDPKLDLQMRTTFKQPWGTIDYEVKSVKAGPQPDSLFELPKHYKIIRNARAPRVQRFPKPMQKRSTAR